jgi:hypothetical protein
VCCFGATVEPHHFGGVKVLSLWRSVLCTVQCLHIHILKSNNLKKIPSTTILTPEKKIFFAFSFAHFKKFNMPSRLGVGAEATSYFFFYSEGEPHKHWPRSTGSGHLTRVF